MTVEMHSYEAQKAILAGNAPADLVVTGDLSFTDKGQLRELPPSLSATSLTIHNCPNLRGLPEQLHLPILDISGCTGLQEWPQTGLAGLHELRMRGCTGLRGLPPSVRDLRELDIRGCTGITELPPYLHLSQGLDIAGTSLRCLPPSAEGFKLRWNGVPISGRAAFYPETLTAREVIAETNAEVRRVLLERMGLDRFFADVQAEELDADRDAGGPRRLLRVTLQGDEPLVCLAVLDPSTGRQYLIRVPPAIQRCHQAAAWIAGFDNPDEYHPVAET